MSEATKKVRDFLTKSPSVVYPDDVLGLFEQVERENARLRELVCHMHECMSNVDADGNHECFVCEYENADCEFDRRMRELGVMDA